MKGAATFAAIAAFIVVLVLLLSAAFTVEQTEQAIGLWQINKQSASPCATVSHETHFLCAPPIST
jgi:hypothetical protein